MTEIKIKVDLEFPFLSYISLVVVSNILESPGATEKINLNLKIQGESIYIDKIEE
jgi:hypothetical protein